jgi:hypothetical protein
VEERDRERVAESEREREREQKRASAGAYTRAGARIFFWEQQATSERGRIFLRASRARAGATV